MYKLKKKIGKVFTSKFVGTGPSSYEKRIYRAAVLQRLRNTRLGDLNGANIYGQVLGDVLRKGTRDSSIQCHTQTTKT